MPHKYSPQKLEDRRVRAVRLGYLQPKKADQAFLLVPAEIKHRALSMVKSLVLHDGHDRVAGVHHHYARHAALHAAPVVGEDAARRAIQVHRLANRAKHGGRAVQLAPPGPLAADAASAGEAGVPLQSQELKWDIKRVLEQMQLKLSQEIMSISATVVQLREDMSQEIQKLSREFTHGYKQAQTVATEPLEFATTEPLYVVATEPLKDGISVSLAGEWREQQNGTVEQQGAAGERQHATDEQTAADELWGDTVEARRRRGAAARHRGAVGWRAGAAGRRRRAAE